MAFAKDDTHPGWNVKPEDWYWENITSGKIDADAPSLSGHWVIIDNTQKPDYDDGKQLYPEDPFKSNLPDESRFSLSWDELHGDVLPKIAERLNERKIKVMLILAGPIMNGWDEEFLKKLRFSASNHQLWEFLLETQMIRKRKYIH